MSENLADYCPKMLTDGQTTDGRQAHPYIPNNFRSGDNKTGQLFSEEGWESNICMSENLVDYCPKDDRVK